MKKVATIILNRNLPKVTDKLVNKVKKDYQTDVYVIEAGSDNKLISNNCTTHVKSKFVKKNGLRFPRGMNLGLSKLWENKKFNKYDFFLLLTNDTEIHTKNFFKKAIKIFKNHPRLGILSPCGKDWGEKILLKKRKILYFWFVHNTAVFLRKEFIFDVMNNQKPGYLNFLYDGNNFRGYGTESELIAKGYSNYWATAITSELMISENENYLLKKSNLIKTEPHDLNLKLYIKEGLEWMKKKYGFKSKWSMQMYVKTFYDKFFEYYPEYKKYMI